MIVCKQCGTAFYKDNFIINYCCCCGFPVDQPIELKIPKIKTPTLNDCYWTFEDLKDYLRKGNKIAEIGGVKF